MRVHNSAPRSDRFDTPFVGADSTAPRPRSASIHLLGSLTRTGGDQSNVRSRRILPQSWNEAAELLTDIDGLPVLVRLLIKDIPAEMQSSAFSDGNDIHSRLSGTLEKMVDHVRACSLQNAPSRQPDAKVHSANGDSSPPALPKQIVL